MCRWCDAGAASLDGFGLELRPGARLGGVTWTGSHAEAVEGGLAAALGRLRDRVIEEAAFVPGPVVAVTLAGQGDEVRCFVGARLAEAVAPPDGLDELPVPEADYAVANHHRDEGAVIDRYGAMLDWIRAEGLVRDRAAWQHREEYPLHANFARPETVRLMVPVKPHR